MRNALIEKVEQQHVKKDLPRVDVGDTVDVHVRIVEGQKERIQVFGGVVIADRGSGMNRMITVRRIVANEGVERQFPVHSPRVADIEVIRHGHTRRAKLFYLRERVGKQRRLQNKRRGLQHVGPDQTGNKKKRADSEKPAGEANPAAASTEPQPTG